MKWLAVWKRRLRILFVSWFFVTNSFVSGGLVASGNHRPNSTARRLVGRVFSCRLRSLSSGVATQQIGTLALRIPVVVPRTIAHFVLSNVACYSPKAPPNWLNPLDGRFSNDALKVFKRVSCRLLSGLLILVVNLAVAAVMSRISLTTGLRARTL